MAREVLTLQNGYCECGCGQRTKIADRNHRARGVVKGEPLRFIHGHHARKHFGGQPAPRLCECGCGGETAVVTHTDWRRGITQGERRRFIQGHSGGTVEPRTLDLTGAYIEDPDTGCWLWQRTIDRGGYAQMGGAYNGGLAHRYFYEQAKGPIPAGLHIDHRCRVRACVNPDHMEPVTNAENCRRGEATKLAVDDVREIRQRLGRETLAQIGAAFGVTEQAIWSIKHGRTWSGV